MSCGWCKRTIDIEYKYVDLYDKYQCSECNTCYLICYRCKCKSYNYYNCYECLFGIQHSNIFTPD